MVCVISNGNTTRTRKVMWLILASRCLTFSSPRGIAAVTATADAAHGSCAGAFVDFGVAAGSVLAFLTLSVDFLTVSAVAQ